MEEASSLRGVAAPQQPAFQEEVAHVVATTTPHVEWIRVVQEEEDGSSNNNNNTAKFLVKPTDVAKPLLVEYLHGQGWYCNHVGYDSMEAVLQQVSPAYRSSFAASVQRELERRMMMGAAKR